MAENDEGKSNDVETVPGLDAGRTRETASALRDRLEPDEREQVERTVAQLLDLEGRLDVPANTLSERLKELVAAGLLRRESYDEVPPRVEYEPTEKGRAVFPAFGHLHAWAIEYDLEPVGD
ncbi:transcriptional regulator [Haloterrigena sp. H1]|uniref:winged helix-turn-helix transcriptional regulator n=1 Tax=Haloterrigena sp. H1 TaxID=2552943 RepID=UPI00110D9740|nr:winged helix-turn-helix transcriptional regulator [Haloterrigena sp. H1]TMT86339.1 transcriptional regulator [Haloterrigena sp. H1]